MLASIRNSLFRCPQATRLARPLSTTTPTPPVDGAPDLASPLSNQDPLTAMANVMDLLPEHLPPDTGKWKVFYSGSFLQPNDLTRGKCLNKRIPKFRPPTGPPAHEARRRDVFHQLNLDPVDFTMSPGVLQAYISEMGKIYGRNVTGLTSHSQRRLGKAIRRARMIGVLPHLNRPTRSWVDISYQRKS